MSELTVFIRHAKRSNSNNVDLSRRELSFIPKELLSIRSIEILNLSDNKIQILEPSITQLYKLKNLNLSNNCLTELPQQVTSLPFLSVLNVSGNPLGSQFEILLSTENQRNPQLSEALKSCFEKQKHEKAPHWLIEPDSKTKSKENNDLLWDEKIFKPESRLAKTTSGRREEKKVVMEKDLQNEAKNGVLQIKLSDLTIGEQISMGGFSTIHKGEYHGLDIAVKKVFNPKINEQVMNDFNTQIAMLSKYRHPNIVLMIGAVTVPPTLCLVMEYVRQGTLYDVIHRKKTVLSDKNKSHIAQQIIQVISYLHKHGICHRDIKSHNILLTSNFDVKLCDFGLAKHKTQLNMGPMQYSGTPTYMAQELFLKKSYDISIDIFALGTLLYELYSGEVPYHGLDPVDIKQKILKDSSLPMKISVKKSILEIINKCRCGQPSERPSFEELMYFDDW